MRRAVLALDPDAAAVRTAQQTAARRVTPDLLDDGQACVVPTGPAVHLTRWHATLDARARALRAAGDPRNLDAPRDVDDLSGGAGPAGAAGVDHDPSRHPAHLPDPDQLADTDAHALQPPGDHDRPPPVPPQQPTPPRTTRDSSDDPPL